MHAPSLRLCLWPPKHDYTFRLSLSLSNHILFSTLRVCRSKCNPPFGIFRLPSLEVDLPFFSKQLLILWSTNYLNMITPFASLSLSLSQLLKHDYTFRLSLSLSLSLSLWFYVLRSGVIRNSKGGEFHFKISDKLKMKLLDLFVAASIPVVKLLLVTAIGSFLALDHINILGEDTRKHMNNIVFYVFNPALVGSNLARTITYESLVELWFMPVNILITFIIGSALGWAVNQITRAPTHLRGLVIGCCAAGNLGNILIIIIPAVCKDKGSPFGAPDVCHRYGMAYASLSMAVGAVYLWSYVYNIVRISSSKSSKVVEIVDSPECMSSRETSISEPLSYKEPLLSSVACVVSEDHADQFALPCTRFVGKAQVTLLDHVKQKFGMLLGKINLKRLFAPSVIGAIVGFVVGLIPQIRTALIGDTAPLRVIQDSVSLLGDGAIPAVTLILGGNLLRGLKGSGIQKSIILGVIVARYIALPLMGIVIVKGALRFGFVHENPLYQFVLLLQFAVPPAMNIGTITQLFGAGESECSVIMLWTYALASISLTIWSTFFMWLVT